MRTLVLSASGLNNVQTCELKYHYAQNLRYYPLDYPVYFDTGTMMHKMLEVYYQRKIDYPPLDFRGEVLQRAVAEAIETGEFMASTELKLDPDAIQENVKVFGEYVIKYENESWEPLVVEAPFTKILFEDEAYDDGTGEIGLRIAIEGKIDLIVKQQGQKMVVDHKTGKRRSEPHPMMNQWRTYCWAAGTTIVVVNQIGYQKTVEKFHRPILTYTQGQLNEYVTYTTEWALRVHHMNISNRYQMNPTGCDKFNGCVYTEICATDPESREYKIKALFGKGKRGDIYD